MTPDVERAKLAVEAEQARRRESGVRYGLMTPSGNIVGTGREKPILSSQDQRDHWKVLRFKPRKRKRT